MTKITLIGCSGTMGNVLTKSISARDDCTIISGVDMRQPSFPVEYPVYDSPEKMEEKPDVIIDFSHPSCFSPVFAYAVKNKVPVVECTTGLSADMIKSIEEYAKTIPVFHSANMSIGVNLISELCRIAVSVLGNDFDIELIEQHHNKKIDAPSGTALMIADEINDASGHKYHYVYDRHSVRQRRDSKELGIHSIRGGTIVGEHEVIFAGHDEVITISHSARSKEIFATGAINAGIFLSKQKPGLYAMRDLIGDKQ